MGMVFEWSIVLSDANPPNRSRAAKALAEAPDWEKKDAIATLEDALKRESFPDVRYDIQEALRSLKKISTQKEAPEPSPNPVEQPEIRRPTPSPSSATPDSKPQEPNQKKASWFKRLGAKQAQTKPSQIGEEILGRYTIRSLLGEGAFGRVYLAVDRQLKSEVAIKELRTRFLTNKPSIEQFANEARIARALQHPNIVVIYDLQPADVPRYIIMEHLTKGSLRQLLRKSGALSTEQAIQIAIAISSGLSQMHQKRIIHRDIKPENILFSEADVPKISDFGIACLPVDLRTMDSNQSDEAHPGTLLYMSPEQIQGKQLDGRSDLYALGVVFYEVLTGKPYLDFSRCQTWDDVEKAILRQAPVPLTQRNPTVSPSLNEIVLTLLEKDQHNRYLDATDLIKALELVREKKGENKVKEFGKVKQQDASIYWRYCPKCRTSSFWVHTEIQQKRWKAGLCPYCEGKLLNQEEYAKKIRE